MIKPILRRLGVWLATKAAPASLTGNQWTGTHFADSLKRNRNPTPNELMAELKATAWTCATINAAVCASYAPRLFVTTAVSQPEPKCATKSISRRLEHRLRTTSHLMARTKSAGRIQEVVDHPLLTLLAHVNPIHNAFDLYTITRFLRIMPVGQVFSWVLGRIGR